MSAKLFRGIIWGAPGSGKGTISARVVRDFGLAYLSVGDLLRSHVARRSAVGVRAAQFVGAGRLVPDAIVDELVIGELQSTCATASWLLDGYPRTVPQAEVLTANVRLDSAIRLVVPDDEIIERIRHRWIHLASGRTYHLKYNPPKVDGRDDLTGEPLIQRDDDKETIVMQRLLAYKQQEHVITDFYRKKGILVEFAGRESNEIYPKIQLFLSQIIPQLK